MTNRYQDYVFKDGRFIGKFEEMYQNCPDPWDRDKMEDLCLENMALRRATEITWISDQTCRVIDLGCGLGSSIAAATEVTGPGLGIDISRTAVEKARTQYPDQRFLTGNVLDFIRSRGECANLDLGPYNLMIMSHVTWYMLPHLREFKDWLEANWQGKNLVHLLGLYASGVQKYGVEFFTDHKGVLDWWNLNYLEHGELTRIIDGDSKIMSYFVAKID